MKTYSLMMICLAAVASAVALAEDPAPAPANTANKTAADAPPAAATPSATAGESKPAAEAPVKASDVSKEQDDRLRALGYRRVARGDNVVYCRKEAVLGSRFTKTVCGSADDIERTAERARQDVQGIQQKGLNQLGSN